MVQVYPETKFTDILPQRISFMGLRRHSFTVVSKSRMLQPADLFIHTKMNKTCDLFFILSQRLSDSYMGSRVRVMVLWSSALPSFIALDRMIKFPLVL